MSQKIVFSPISNLKLDTNIVFRDIHKQFVLSNDNDILKPLYYKQDFIEGLGKTAHEILKDLPFFATETDDLTKFGSIQNFVLISEAAFKAFLTSMWLVKDNAVNFKYTILYNEEQEFPVGISTGSSSALNSISKIDEVVFTQKELELANENLLIISEISKSLNLETITKPRYEKTTVFGTNNAINYNKYNRLNKSLTFISFARASILLPLKITLYISALEALFAVSKVELKFRLSIVISKYITDERDKQLKYYIMISNAYDVRSNFIHGGDIDSKHNKENSLETISKDIDEIARLVFNKALKKDIEKFTAKKDDKLKALIEELLF